MILYHCTTPKKLKRYEKTGCILSPVRGWINIDSAKNWCQRTSKSIILKINCIMYYPLPNHKPFGHAAWTPEVIYDWEILEKN